jgi:hypothetical protein
MINLRLLHPSAKEVALTKWKRAIISIEKDRQASFVLLNRNNGMIYMLTNRVNRMTYIGITRRSMSKTFKSHYRRPAKRESLLSRDIEGFGYKQFSIKHFATAIYPEHLEELKELILKQENPYYNYPVQNLNLDANNKSGELL